MNVAAPRIPFPPRIAFSTPPGSFRRQSVFPGGRIDPIVHDYITGVLRDEMRAAISGIEDPEERLKAAFRRNLETVQANQDVILEFVPATEQKKPGKGGRPCRSQAKRS